MKISIRSIAGNVARIMLISAFASTAFAQALEESLEDVGVITSVSPATSTFSVGDRSLRVTTTTRVTADDVAFRNTGISNQWLGQSIGMETNEAPDGTITVERLHIFSAPQ